MVWCLDNAIVSTGVMVSEAGPSTEQVIKNCAIRLCWGRRNTQMRGQPQLAGLAPPPAISPYQAGMLPGFGAGMLPGYGAGFAPKWPPQAPPAGMLGSTNGVLPGVPQPPHPILDAALHAAAGLPTGLPAPSVRLRTPAPEHQCSACITVSSVIHSWLRAGTWDGVMGQVGDALS